MKQSHHTTELNLTPLLVNNLEMTPPSGKPPPQNDKDKPKPNKIVVSAEDNIFLNDAPYTPPELNTELQHRKAANPDLAVVAKGSDEVDYQHMVNALDILQQLDSTKVGLATDAVQ